MRQSSAGFSQQSPEGESACSNSELWHACAGPLVSLPALGSRVVYFPQGHSEQVAASTNKEVDAHIPSYPGLPSQLVCQLHNVTMHADVETDEEEQKDVSFHPADLGAPSKQPTNYFCKTLTASDTSTHGGFSVPRRSAEKVFPPLDFSQQPPCQELIARDLHDNEWKFRHIFRGQPKRHLLTTGWSVFVSAKRLVAGDSVLFIWNEKNQLLLGIRRASRPQTVMPSSVLSSDSMHFGLLAAAAHAASTNSRFTIFFNPRASPAEFVISLAKYVKAVYHTRVSVGMRFRMLFETEESSVRRYMGTITGISDLDPARWPNSHWRSVKVGWDESTAGERQPRVSLWEIEPLTTFPMYPSPFPYRLKRPWPPGLPSFNDEMGVNSSLMWLPGDNGNGAIQSLNFQGMGVTPWIQPTPMFNMQNGIYQAMAANALQNIRAVDPTKQAFSPVLQFQHPQNMKENQLNSISQAQSESHLHQQQLHHQHSFDNQQQNQHVASSAISALPHFSSNSQTQSPSLQAISSMCQQHQGFSSSKGNPMTNDTIVSPLHSFMGLFPEDEPSQLLNLPRNDALLSPSGWPLKRVAVDYLTSPNIISLPPFPGRECSIDQEQSHDSQKNNSFGVNIDSTSLLMQNGMTGSRGIVSDSVSMNLSFASPNNYMGTARNNFSLNPAMATSGCIDESGFLQSSDNQGQGNTTTGTFVKVYRSGSFGRSLDISKFSSYHELRSELGRMFGLEGQLEDPLRSGWQLVFVDRENDILLLGDDPWQEFVNSVWCIKILSPEEVHEMGEKGLELLNSVPSQKLSNNGNCDDDSNRHESRNLSSGLASLGSFDY